MPRAGYACFGLDTLVGGGVQGHSFAISIAKSGWGAVSNEGISQEARQAHEATFAGDTDTLSRLLDQGPELLQFEVARREQGVKTFALHNPGNCTNL